MSQRQTMVSLVNIHNVFYNLLAMFNLWPTKFLEWTDPSVKVSFIIYRVSNRLLTD